jgi:hypothetical protein
MRRRRLPPRSQTSDDGISSAAGLEQSLRSSMVDEAEDACNVLSAQNNDHEEERFGWSGQHRDKRDQLVIQKLSASCSVLDTDDLFNHSFGKLPSNRGNLDIMNLIHDSINGSHHLAKKLMDDSSVGQTASTCPMGDSSGGFTDDSQLSLASANHSGAMFSGQRSCSRRNLMTDSDKFTSRSNLMADRLNSRCYLMAGGCKSASRCNLMADVRKPR